jgi:hypothetical protein
LRPGTCPAGHKSAGLSEGNTHEISDQTNVLAIVTLMPRRAQQMAHGVVRPSDKPRGRTAPSGRIGSVRSDRAPNGVRFLPARASRGHDGVAARPDLHPRLRPFGIGAIQGGQVGEPVMRDLQPDDCIPIVQLPVLRWCAVSRGSKPVASCVIGTVARPFLPCESRGSVR